MKFSAVAVYMLASSVVAAEECKFKIDFFSAGDCDGMGVATDVTATGECQEYKTLDHVYMLNTKWATDNAVKYAQEYAGEPGGLKMTCDDTKLSVTFHKEKDTCASGSMTNEFEWDKCIVVEDSGVKSAYKYTTAASTLSLASAALMALVATQFWDLVRMPDANTTNASIWRT